MGEPLKLDGKALEIAQMVNRNYVGADNDKEKLLENKGEIRMFKEQASLYNLDKADVEAILGHDDVKAVMGDDWTTLMGLERSESAQATTNPSEAASKPISKDDKARANQTVIDKIVNVASSSTAPNDPAFIDKLTESLGVLADNAYYKELINDVKDMVAQFPAFNSESGYGSKETVEGIHKTLKKHLKAQKKWDAFHKEALKKLEAMAEQAQRQVEHDKIDADFKEAMKADGANLESAFKAVSEKYKNQKSYFKEELEKYEEKEIMSEARIQVRAAIQEVSAEKSKEVKKLTKAKLQEKGQWNKYTEKALGGENNFVEWISGHDSDMKIARKNRASEVKVERIATTPQSKEEILKALGKKNELFDEMVAAGLIIPTADGKYDLKPLSDLIGLNVGENYKMDRQEKAFKAISESTKTTSALAAAAGLKDLDEDQAKDLVKLCGYKVEGKNWGKALLGATLGAITSAANSAIIAATNPTKQALYIHKPIETNIKVDVGQVSDVSALNNELQQKYGADLASATVNGTQVIVNIKSAVDVFMVVKLAKHINMAALKGSIYGAALGLVAGLKDSPEKPITSTQFECTDFESYKARLQNEAKNNKVQQEYVDALLMIASTFVDKDGNWDCDAYKMALNRAAGDGGILNREELIGLLSKKETKQTTEQPEETEQPQQKKFGKYSECDIQTTQTVDVPTIDGKNTGWPAIAKQYQCLIDKYGLNMTIRILKIAQGIIDGDFSEERLVKLARASFRKDLDTLKDEPNFNYNTYRNALKATFLDKVMVPDNLAGCDRDENVSLQFKPTTFATKVVKPGTVDNKYQQSSSQKLYKTSGSDDDDRYVGFDKSEYQKRREKWAQDGRDVQNVGCK